MTPTAEEYRFVPIPWTRPRCQLCLPEKIVFGSLVAAPKGRSARDLADLVPLSRPTVTAALKGTSKRNGLLKRGLARQDESGLWHACEPTGQLTDWFFPRQAPTDAPWTKRLAYWPLPIPTDRWPLGVHAAATMWLAAALQTHPKKTSAAGIAQFLGVRAETVVMALNNLAGQVVLSFTRGDKVKSLSDLTFADPLPPAFASWWLPRHREEPKSPPAGRKPAPRPAPAVQPVPEAEPPKPKAADKPPVAQQGMPDHLREGLLEVMAEHRVDAASQRTLMGMAERINLGCCWEPQPAGLAKVLARADKNPGAYAIQCWQARVQEADEECRRAERERVRKEQEFAPLASQGLTAQLPCPSCGEKRFVGLVPLPRERWPAEACEAADRLQAAGLAAVQVGRPLQRCPHCRGGWPGLVLSARHGYAAGVMSIQEPAREAEEVLV